MAHHLGLARPVVCAAAGFHANQARRQVHEERRHLVSAKPRLYQYLPMLVDSVDLEHILGQVDANSRKLHDRRPFSVQVVDQRLHFGTAMPLWAGAFIPLHTVLQPSLRFLASTSLSALESRTVDSCAKNA